MDYELTESQQRYNDLAEAFHHEHRERLIECKQRSEFPLDLFEKGAEEGIPGVFVPTEYGGGGHGAMEYRYFPTGVRPGAKPLL